jgi:preprotein translocase subunit SecG
VQIVFMVVFLLAAVMLTLLVLIQRGRGGGLAGAFGGQGGSSAFGTKTADVFVKATAVIGAAFFLLSILTAWLVKPEKPGLPPAPPASSAPETGGAASPAAVPAAETPATETPATETPPAAPAAPAGEPAAPAAPAETKPAG